MKATDWKLGTSSWFLGDAEVICEKDFETAKKGGVDCIELTHGMIWQPDLKKYRKFADNTGIDLWSFHTPVFTASMGKILVLYYYNPTL